MFKGESPANDEQKCLCVLVVDVSTSMSGDPINQLNLGLQEFHTQILSDFLASQRLEVCIVTFGSSIRCIQEPKLVTDFEMPTLAVSGTTKLVEGVNKAMEIIEDRKEWYRSTGQNYFRPMIFLFTDGEPDADQNITKLAGDLTLATSLKKFLFYSIGVQGYNHNKLAQICSSPPPLPLSGLKFTEFFRWLSNSIGVITKSVEGDIIKLPPVDDWTQIQM